MNFQGCRWTCVIFTLLKAQAAPTVFQAGVQLVQVRVIEEDKDGKPVTDLREEEFRLLDNGLSQDVRLFLNESERSSGAIWVIQKAVIALHSLPPGENLAIYATGYKLRVIREFTQDRESRELKLAEKETGDGCYSSGTQSRAFCIRNELKIPRKTGELKILIANIATGKIGTVTIRLSDLGGYRNSAQTRTSIQPPSRTCSGRG